MKIDLTENEMKIIYNKLNNYIIQRDVLKDMGCKVKNDKDMVWAIMCKMQKVINEIETEHSF